MWTILIFFVICIWFQSVNTQVIDLSSENIDDFLQNHELSMVEFFAPWCGHCKKLAPAYNDAATELLKDDIILAKVDCTAEHNKAICTKYGVTGFPTLQVFRKGEDPIQYKQGRTAVDIVKFMKKRAAPAFIEIASITELKKFQSSSSIAVLAGLEKAEGEEYEIFTKLANKYRDNYEFAFSTTKHEFEFLSAGNTIIMFKDFDDRPAIYKGPFEITEIGKWLTLHSFPLMDEINADSYQKYLERDIPIFYFFIDPDKELTKTIIDIARDIAADFIGKLSFVYLNGVQWKRYMKGTFGVDVPPGAAIQDDRKIYKFSGSPVNSEAVRKFAEDFVAGEITPWLKSQEPPKENSSPVTVVVGKTFEDIVHDETKDVFVEFYAPWCGHCKKLVPAWDKLGETFIADDNIVIAKVDATENDTPAKISGFPTLIFYAADDKEGKAYKGDRNVEAFVHYIKENRSTKKETAEKTHEEL